MKKKILTFTMSLRQSQFEVDRLEEEAKKMGIGVNRALYSELTFKVDNGEAKVYVRGEEINSENTMAVWFRVAGTVSGKYIEGRNLLIRILSGRGIFCVNCGSYLGWPRMGKIAQHGVFIEAGIPVVPTRIFYKKEQIPLNLPLTRETFWGYPVICKHDRGYQGKSVKKFNNLEDVEKWLKKVDETQLGMYLWQKYLPTRWDLRIIVLGGKAIGAMKRSAKQDEFRSNFSLGGSVEVWNLSENDKFLAEKVAKVCGLDYCGVDIMKDEDNNSYVLEVNRQCQFKGFEQSTGINVAKLVVEMLAKTK